MNIKDLIKIMTDNDKKELYSVLKQEYYDNLEKERKKDGTHNRIATIEVNSDNYQLFSNITFRGYINTKSEKTNEEIYDWLLKFEYEKEIKIIPNNLKNCFRLFGIMRGLFYYPNFKKANRPLKLVKMTDKERRKIIKG